MTTQDIYDFLQSHLIKPSMQRIKIFEYLITYRSHPTVDEIYNVLHPEIPSLSKTTVYNTLKLFVEKKVAIPILIEENEIRYDADTSLHGHFKCIDCNKIFDFLISKEERDNLPSIKDFDITEHHIYLKGSCDKCKKNKA